MDKIKKIITFLSVLCTLYANVYADDSPETYINVIQSVNGEQTTVYSGDLEGYDNGIFTDVDYFLELDYAVIFNQDSPDNEMLYIVPSTSDVHLGDITANAQPMQNTMQLQNTVTSSAISTNVSLMYNDEYHESVLLPGETLTVPVTVTNSGELTAEINSYIATYDLTGKLINITQGNLITVPGNQTVTANVSNGFDVDTTCTAKVFFWQKDNINPVADSIYLTVQSQDYYANNYEDAQSYDISKVINGNIDAKGDVDYIKFIPSISCIYIIQSLEGNICGSLYDSSQMLISDGIFEDNKFYIKEKLIAGETYYIKVSGDVGAYSLIANSYVDLSVKLYDTSLSIFGNTIEPVQNTTIKIISDNEEVLYNQNISVENAENIDVNIPITLDNGKYRIIVGANEKIISVVDLNVLKDFVTYDANLGGFCSVPYVISNAKTLENVYFSLEFSSDDFDVYDVCEYTLAAECGVGLISGGYLNVIEKNNNYCIFKSTRTTPNWSGTVNSIKLKSKSTGRKDTIRFIYQVK